MKNRILLMMASVTILFSTGTSIISTTNANASVQTYHSKSDEKLANYFFKNDYDVTKISKHESIGKWYYTNAVKLANNILVVSSSDAHFDAQDHDNSGQSIAPGSMNDEDYRALWIITFANNGNYPTKKHRSNVDSYNKANQIYNDGVKMSNANSKDDVSYVNGKWIAQ